MRRWLLLLLAASWGSSGLAQTSVYSPRADATSITIYRDGIAQITETRRVDLPAGPVTLVLQGVVETLLPQSAVVAGLDRRVAESNYDFDALTVESLIRHSVGRQVTVVRTDRVRGVETRSLATIVSAEEGVVLRFESGSEALHCSGLPERLEFSEVPGGLTGKPQLSVKLAAGAAGPRTVTVSYIAQRFRWSADYVAQLNAVSNRVNLHGWVTLDNGTDTNFRGAQVQVVAGRLGVLREEERGSRPADYDSRSDDDEDGGSGLPAMLTLPACHPAAPPQFMTNLLSRMDVISAGASAEYGDNLSEVQVTGTRIISREQLGDYKLYRIDWPTDLNAKQTKQAAFMHAEDVKVERVYRVQFPLVPALEGWREADEDSPATVGLRWSNRKSAGLGEPMPAGKVTVFEQGAEGQVFAGEARIQDQPVGSVVEFDFARAMNFSVANSFEELPEEQAEDDEKSRDIRRGAARMSHYLVNRKSVPISVEVQPLLGRYRWQAQKITRASKRHTSKDGDPLWVITLPGGGEYRLTYEISAVSQD